MFNVLICTAQDSLPAGQQVLFEIIFAISLYPVCYLLFNPSLAFALLKAGQEMRRGINFNLNEEYRSTEELLLDARKQSHLSRALAPTMMTTILVSTNLIYPYNWLFAIIFGPLLALSYYKVVGSIMDLQTPDDETSDEKTD